MMKPVSFDKCLGWFYPGNSGKGVVLCSAFGLEEVRYRKTLSQLADDLAARGLNVLRFDYYGTGNSAGTTLDPDILDKCTGNIRSAAAWLRGQAGCRTVSLAGVRFGAILAAQAAEDEPNLDELVLLAPPASGASYAAELLRATAPPSRLGQNSGPNAHRAILPFDGVDIGGYRLGRKTLDELQSFEWQGLRRCGAAHIRIFAETRSCDLPAMKEAFATLGGDVRIEDFASFERAHADARAASRKPHEWTGIAELFNVTAVSCNLKTDALDSSPAPFCPLSGPGFVETPVALGPDDGHTGILCQSSGGLETRKAVIFLQSVETHGAGWPRLPVELSRRLARLGIACLRLDPAFGGCAEDGAQNSAAFSEVMDWLKSRRYSDIILAGTTAREDRAAELADSDRRVDQLLLLDLPPLPLSSFASPDIIRREDQTGFAGDRQPAARRTVGTNRSALRKLADMAADLCVAVEPLGKRLLPFARSGKPVVIVQMEGAQCSAALAEFVRSGISEKPEFSSVAIHLLDVPGNTLASDIARQHFGDVAVNFCGADTSRAPSYAFAKSG